MRSLIMGWLGNVALDGIHLFRLHTRGKTVHLRLQLLDDFVLLDDGLVERLNQFLQVCQAGLDVDQPFIIRHEDSLHRSEP